MRGPAWLVVVGATCGPSPARVYDGSGRQPCWQRALISRNPTLTKRNRDAADPPKPTGRRSAAHERTKRTSLLATLPRDCEARSSGHQEWACHVRLGCAPWQGGTFQWVKDERKLHRSSLYVPIEGAPYAISQRLAQMPHRSGPRKHGVQSRVAFGKKPPEAIEPAHGSALIQ
jgi:hypothetical protein